MAKRLQWNVGVGIVSLLVLYLDDLDQINQIKLIFKFILSRVLNYFYANITNVNHRSIIMRGKRGKRKEKKSMIGKFVSATSQI